ncbi:V-type ATP synthase subunit D [bacterium]|nr:V-type ATP synthase subunit D [bacterium]
MAKVRLTKNELKKQKDNLKRFTRYLPTLELKKKQLLVEIRNIQHEIEKLDAETLRVEQEITRWVDVFAEEIDLSEFIQVKEVITGEDNIAGIEIPTFENIIFEEPDIDYFNTPLWIDTGIEVACEQIKRQKAREIAQRQEVILQEELRTTIQRIKLFEEVKIPEAKENIRVIQIFMGDQQTAEVVRGKIAKTKIVKKKMMEGTSA